MLRVGVAWIHGHLGFWRGNPVGFDYLLTMLTERIAASLLERPGRHDSRAFGARQAAVAVIIRPDGGVLFIRRAEYEGDPWSGHIALPGGRVDPGDISPEAAARREALEEVGVNLSGARLLGMLDQVVSPDLAPRVVVSPFVYAIDSVPVLNVDETEVADAFWLGLDRLMGAEGRGTFTLEFQGRTVTLPRIELDGARIWGMTLRVVDDLVGRTRGGP